MLPVASLAAQSIPEAGAQRSEVYHQRKPLQTRPAIRKTHRHPVANRYACPHADISEHRSREVDVPSARARQPDSAARSTEWPGVAPILQCLSRLISLVPDREAGEHHEFRSRPASPMLCAEMSASPELPARAMQKALQRGGSDDSARSEPFALARWRQLPFRLREAKCRFPGSAQMRAQVCCLSPFQRYTTTALSVPLGLCSQPDCAQLYTGELCADSSFPHSSPALYCLAATRARTPRINRAPINQTREPRFIMCGAKWSPLMRRTPS